MEADTLFRDRISDCVRDKDSRLFAFCCAADLDKKIGGTWYHLVVDHHCSLPLHKQTNKRYHDEWTQGRAE